MYSIEWLLTLDKNDLIDGDGFEAIAKELGITYSEGRNLNQQIDNDVVLYHNGDGCVLAEGVIRNTMGEHRTYDLHANNIPGRLKILFSQNVDVHDSRILPLPIGLERKRWFGHINKQEKLFNMMRQDIPRDKLAYLNVNPQTNHKSRIPLINAMLNNDWCTKENRTNGADYDNYLNQLKTHKFVFSPEGNGIDCHRTWEALYLGAIPIVERSVSTEYFSRFIPMLIVDRWELITEELLNKTYEVVNDMSFFWNWDALKISYWKDIISNMYEGNRKKYNV